MQCNHGSVSHGYHGSSPVPRFGSRTIRFHGSGSAVLGSIQRPSWDPLYFSVALCKKSQVFARHELPRNTCKRVLAFYVALEVPVASWTMNKMEGCLSHQYGSDRLSQKACIKHVPHPNFGLLFFSATLDTSSRSGCLPTARTK